MSYASFIAFVVSHVQQRIDTSKDGEVAAHAVVFCEQLQTVVASTDGNITEASSVCVRQTNRHGWRSAAGWRYSLPRTRRQVQGRTAYIRRSAQTN